MKSLYEAWVFPTDFDGRPVCLVCTELPEGIAPGEDQTAWVRFDGWFFKKMWFESGERNSKGGNEWKPAALLLGRTFERRPPPDDDSGGLTFANTLVPGVIALAVLILSLAIGLTWWFHRQDRRVRTPSRINDYATIRLVRSPWPVAGTTKHRHLPVEVVQRLTDVGQPKEFLPCRPTSSRPRPVLTPSPSPQAGRSTAV